MTAAPTAASAPLAHAAIVQALAQSTKHRRHTTPVVRWLMTDPETRTKGRAIANCALRLQLEAATGPDDPPEARLTAARLCNARLCPYCEWRRSRVQRARLLTGAAQLLTEHPRLTPLMLTLTVRNVPVDGLRDTLAQVHTAWHRLTKRDAFPAAFWYRRTEVTVSTPKARCGRAARNERSIRPWDAVETGEVTVHPHLHCLLFVTPSYFHKRYISQAAWTEHWRQCLAVDYDPIVDVRRAYGETGETASGSLPLSAVMEASKYITKAADLPALGPLVSVFDDQVRGVRMRAVSRQLSPYVSARDASTAELVDLPVEVAPGGSAPLRVIAAWCDRQGLYLPT